ncbi:run domain Beclin-1-interacting and cysteine-rich domain-containing protein-like isoform X2 [Penaeus japonicus]|uniref:run domain Beclin-1-interacting and cysteine-rich domain-containing protein-like isoform X2 n=1 Tax=Penaeus japonicus TaxID=27405 RepID=UPI001C712DB2|nr:run domain Beclin-1-interacting and cysteine-rich domain-containing protein-like isoform X2 [Penaeus japonicus]
MTEGVKEPHCAHPKHLTCACGHRTGDWQHGRVPSAAIRDQCVAIRTLLSDLVNTVGAVLTSRPKHVWQVYGGFQRIYEATKNIFYHGCIHSDTQGNADIWPFVVGLRVLSPVLGPYTEVSSVSRPADEWIHSSLQKLQLAAKVTALTIDKDYVKKHYQPWALLCSPAHTAAVIKCLQALEENSQDLLADIDPKLLVGTQWISSGSAVESIHHRPSGLPRHILDGQSLEKKKKSPEKRNTSSLPTSPITDRNWAPVWPTQSDNGKRRGEQGFVETPKNDRAASKYTTDPVNINRNCSRKLFPNDNIVPLRRGKSEASIKVFMKGHFHPWEQPVRKDQEDRSITLMTRESPDGSSGSSDWPATSPVSQVPSFIGKDISEVSSSTIAKLVQGKSPGESVSGTGARPKDSIIPQPLVIQQFCDVSDSGSGPRSNISPSLLQVDYGGENTASEGEASSLYSLHNQRAGLGFRTPQLRRRASSWRMMSVPADSDQDSEDTTDGSMPQASRRRRRLTPSQQRSGMSVKLLVDSRGILVAGETQGIEKQNGSKDIVSETFVTDQPSKDQNIPELSPLHHSTLDPSSESVSQLSKTNQPVRTPQLTDQVGSTVPHRTSTPVTAALHPDATDGIAFSAPGRVFKPSNLDIPEMSKSKKKTHGRSRSDGAQELVGKLRLSTSNTEPTLESGGAPGKISGSKEDVGLILQNPVRKRFMEDGGQSITLAADYGFFPRPQPGQSLIGFLSSKEFHKPYAELDRENAHFNISEAVIAALTQMQFDTWNREITAGSITAEDSDEEIRNLQARIREKRRQKLSGTAVSASPSVSTLTESTSDPQRWVRSLPLKVESTTDYSVCESPQSSTYNSESDLLSDFEEEYHNGSSIYGEETTLPLSRKTSVSDSIIFKGDLTAENVALNLLKHFSEQKLPKASELEWLVSEQEAPQKLLPLPTSVAVSPDDSGVPKDFQQPQTQLRGTSEWAPPRPQVILTLHTNTKRSVLMGTQGWRCAGCGMRVSERLSRHFRLCHYLGRYFCTTCHSNQTAVIPAKVLHKWDFKLYPVASFSSELLERMRSDPLFNVGAVNPRLYKRCRHLHQTHIYRLQLYHTLPYINTCSRGLSERAILGKLPQHWANDPHVYSLDDLLAIKGGQLVAEIKDVTSVCISHIAKCQVCLGRGFICEVCGRGEAIFPFQLDSTARCECCNACFHAGCFSPARCPRCIRRESRRSSREVIEKQDSVDSSSSKES